MKRAIAQQQEWYKTLPVNYLSKTRTKQILKFQRLLQSTTCQPSNRANNPLSKTTTVHNLSKRELNEDVENVLNLGLSFAITPKCIPKEEIVQQRESTLAQMPAETDSNIRVPIANTLLHAKLPKNNFQEKRRGAIKSLRTDETIHILKADKGNCTSCCYGSRRV